MEMNYYIAGVDEAGRGPLAGPVVAAAVILDPNKPIQGLRDSKQLSPSKRESLFTEIINKALAFAFGQAEAEEIDAINILQASLLAMRRAVLNLFVEPARVLVDGNQKPHLPYEVDAIVKGDQKIEAISAASILAKVSRDRQMLEYHLQYPDYGFDQHKGYPTKDHMTALQKFGITPLHRKSFAPVKNRQK
ncbi:MAG: ribonuclease HII [Gammaproteobacteria bacterium RIFOXYB2_FULL_38_6]|nr:MAG: ribonuclease HII [Gammaproteobacteria bacterium RIFOXYB2_FULL_38_6]